MKQFVLLILTIFGLIYFFSCRFKISTHEVDPPTSTEAFERMEQQQELRVLTLNSSVSYFTYKGVEMGVNYELIRNFAISQGVSLKVILSPNLPQMIEMLRRGEGDIIAYNVPQSQELKRDLLFCGIESVSAQVLVQRRHKGFKPLTNVTQLVGKRISVEEGSVYAERLAHLNNELGGGIEVEYVNSDSLVTEDLISMVSQGSIDYTLSDKLLAQLNRTYHHNLHIDLEVSFPQRSSWVVRADSPRLAQAIDSWCNEGEHRTEYNSLMKRYFEYSKRPPAAKVLSVKDGRISIYDELFKQYSQQIGWDWRLLASQAFHESRFDTLAISWAGARGIMQIMPITARHFNVSPDSLVNPETSVRVGTLLLKEQLRNFKKIEDPDERIKFVLAAYNTGAGHIYDAMALAEKYHKDSHKWEGNVADYLLLKSNPEFYNDTICKHGYLRGSEPINYVNRVLQGYQEYKSTIAL